MKTQLSLVSAAILLASSPASADIVHLDDVIATFSMCVGNDCVNGESFGFDTLRLKENNVRIKFDDTSTSASFPNNDWQLSANETSNGGANKFSIEDITGGRIPFTIEAGTRTNQLYVDSSSRVGFGTNTPVVDLHVKQGNTPTLRLEQDGSSGFTAQTWDLAGNEANFFIRDVTNGSELNLRIFPNAGSNLLNLKDNKVGINDTNPTSQLVVKNTEGTTSTRNMLNLVNNGGSRLLFENTNTGILWKLNSTNSDRMEIAQTSAGEEGKLVLEDNGATDGLFVGIGKSNPQFPIEHKSGAHLTTGGVWTDASSRSLKKDIRSIDTAEAKQALHELEPVTFIYKSQQDERYAGFIAEDVPEIVAHNDRSSLSPMDIVAVLTKVVQEQDERIQTLQDRLDKIEGSK